MTKVTVLMPVYNGETYLREAIDSVLNQTFRDFTLLIINDGSTDGTQSIIDSYSDSRIKVHLQKNQGVSRSLNNGIALVDTPYIRRHDADDISEPWMLEQQMLFLNKNPDISFVGTMCAFMTDRSKVAIKYTQPKKPIFNNSEYIIVDKSHFNPYSPIVHGTVLGPTAIFKEMNGYRTEFLTSEDNDLWLRIIERYKFAVLNSCPYYLRLSATSATQVHKSSTKFYRELALSFAFERSKKGNDPLLRGEPMPLSDSNIEITPSQTIAKGKHYRNDLLDFNYKVALNAKDKSNSIKIIIQSLKSGWKLSQTWKAILFPLLNKKIIEAGVNFKGKFK